jgi:hypothetical protein
MTAIGGYPVMKVAGIKHKAQTPCGIVWSILQLCRCCEQGVAAATCRHEFTLVAVNLFTHENFVYYELILERLLRMYDVEKGKKLMCFFLDIMCQFGPYWRRCIV